MLFLEPAAASRAQFAFRTQNVVSLKAVNVQIRKQTLNSTYT